MQIQFFFDKFFVFFLDTKQMWHKAAKLYFSQFIQILSIVYLSLNLVNCFWKDFYIATSPTCRLYAQRAEKFMFFCVIRMNHQIVF